MSDLYQEMQRGVSRGIESDGRWLFFESAIVADVDDPDRQHRIKVILPSIDDDLIFDEWVRPASQICLGNGFGTTFIPEKGTEVWVTGVLGQKFNLVYTGPAYNESCHIHEDFGKDVAGIRVPRDLWFLAVLLLKLQGQNIRAIAEQLARIEATTIESAASEMNKITGETVEVNAQGEAKLFGQTVRVNGNTIQINADGSITISAGGNVSVTASGNLTLQGRTVNKVGPAI